jgi:hypothetical protein
MQRLLTFENWAVFSNYWRHKIISAFLPYLYCPLQAEATPWSLIRYLKSRFRKLEAFSGTGLERHTRSHIPEERILDSLTYSYEHMLCRHTYVKRDFLPKPRNSNLYCMLHTRHKISTSNVSKTQVHSHWFCNYKHATAPSLWVITPIIDTNKAANTACGT